MTERVVTLAYIQEGDQLLLGFKKRGFGQGLWNGFGGKVQPDETPAVAAAREVEEETGFSAVQVEPAGQLVFESPNGEELRVRCHLFRVSHHEGRAQEGEEMRPAWFHVWQLPYETMWESDHYWLPHFLIGRNIQVTILFTADNHVERSQVQIERPVDEELDRAQFYTVLHGLPPGRVVTYGQLAQQMGSLKPRQIGQLLHTNPDGQHLPCHRVVDSRGRLAERFAFGGLAGQAERLQAEGVLVHDGRVELKRHQWQFWPELRTV